MRDQAARRSRPAGRLLGSRGLIAFAALVLLLSSAAPVAAAGPEPTPGDFMAEGQSRTSAGAATLIPAPVSDFIDSVVLDGLITPTALRFADDGRILVATKSGRVRLYNSWSDPDPCPGTANCPVNILTNVLTYWDRGLLGLALDPNFETNGLLYVAYTYDHILGSSDPPPRWGDTCPSLANGGPGATTDGCVVSGRVSRFDVDNPNVETVLVEDWCQQFPSHSIGALAFGPDGYLYATGGDGASFLTEDYGQFGGTSGSPTPANPCGDPPNGIGVANTSPSGQGGALRSQSLRRAIGQPVSLDGSIIRINPSTGAAAPGNPLAGNANANAARIVAYGFRNPFRVAFRPGTSELWIGDVGYNSWEEIDRLVDPVGSTVENFGWPCYEAAVQPPGYADLTQCQDLYAPGAGAVVSPHYTYSHTSAVVAGDGCSTANGSSITGLAFYEGGPFPAKYDDALFFADHTRNCIWAMLATNGVPDPAKRELLVGDAGHPVDLQVGPDGNLYYVDFDEGQIHRVSWSPNTPPVAVMSADPVSGVAPLDVDFSAAGSSDPDAGDTISYGWDFTDDGVIDATGPTASHQYGANGTYTARLTVTDNRGASSSDTATISVGSGPPVPSIAAPTTAVHWAVGDSIAFSGSATSFDGSPLPASALSWSFAILHCPSPGSCHEHGIEQVGGVASGSFGAPDHAYPSAIKITLTATDGALSASRTVQIDPRTVTLRFATNPNLLSLAFNATAVKGTSSTPTISRTVIVNSQNSLTATSPQVLNGVERTFTGWSDGSTAKSRTIVAPATWPTTLTANYAATSADVYLTQKAVRVSSSTVRWKVVGRNASGGLTARDLKIRVDLSSKLRKPTFEASGWSCTWKSEKRRIVCKLSSLAPGAKLRFRFWTTIRDHTGSASNTARILTTTRDVTTANNTVTTSISVR